MRRFDYAKKNIISFCFLFVFAVLFSGCCTCGKLRADAQTVVSGNSRATGKLEATITALDGTVTNSRERIANIIETSRGITDGVERVEYLFNEYESEVERLLDEIDRIRNEAEIQGKDNNDSGDNSTDFYNGSRYLIDSKNKVWDKDSLLAESSTITDKVN